MASDSSHNVPSTNIDMFLAKHPEVQVGRPTLEKLQSENSGGNTFAVINKPFPSMVLYQEFDAETNERLYVVALIDDQKALDSYAEENSRTTEEGNRCDCAEYQGPDHLIFDRVIELKKPDCKEHKDNEEPDPTCSACWPVFGGSNCSR